VKLHELALSLLAWNGRANRNGSHRANPTKNNCRPRTIRSVHVFKYRSVRNRSSATTISRQRADTDALRPSDGAALTAALETFKDKTARHVSLLAQATKCVPEATKIHRGRTADLRVPNLEGLGYCDRVGLSGGAGVCWVVPPWSLWPHIRLYMNNHKMPHDPTSMGGFFTCTMLRGAKTHPTAWRSTQSWPSCC